MTDERYKFLVRDDSAPLTAEEIAERWHFCCEFDGLLIGPGMGGEMQHCFCFPRNEFNRIAREMKE